MKICKIAGKAIMMFIFSMAVCHLPAQVLNPVKWDFSVKKISKTESELVFTATMEKGWHLYSQFVPEGGPIPTSFKIDKGMGFFTVGNVTEPKPIEVMDKNFDMVVKYFSETAVFRQKVRVASDKPVEVKGIVEYMCCDDERCLPPTEEPFSFKLPASK